MYKTQFGERLRELRTERGFGVIQFSKLLGVSHSTISRWENGLQEPDFYYAIEVAKFFGVSLDFLAGLSEY